MEKKHNGIAWGTRLGRIDLADVTRAFFDGVVVSRQLPTFCRGSTALTLDAKWNEKKHIR
jgi:hypothetical protein